jgi:hypothetical protein
MKRLEQHVARMSARRRGVTLRCFAVLMTRSLPAEVYEGRAAWSYAPNPGGSSHLDTNELLGCASTGTSYGVAPDDAPRVDVTMS